MQQMRERCARALMCAEEGEHAQWGDLTGRETERYRSLADAVLDALDLQAVGEQWRYVGVDRPHPWKWGLPDPGVSRDLLIESRPVFATGGLSGESS